MAIELLYENLSNKKVNGDPMEFFEISKDELTQLWFEEQNSDGKIAALFGIYSDTVTKRRRQLGVMTKYMTPENEERREQISTAKWEKEWEKSRRKNRIESFLQEKSRIMGMLDVLIEKELEIDTQIDKREWFKAEFGVESISYKFNVYKVLDGGDKYSNLNLNKKLLFTFNVMHNTYDDKENVRLILQVERPEQLYLGDMLQPFFKTLEKKIEYYTQIKPEIIINKKYEKIKELEQELKELAKDGILLDNATHNNLSAHL